MRDLTLGQLIGHRSVRWPESPGRCWYKLATRVVEIVSCFCNYKMNTLVRTCFLLKYLNIP